MRNGNRYLVLHSRPWRWANGKRVRATELWIPTTDLPLASSHPFYRRLNEVLRLGDFDTFVERACQKFYAARMGRPSLPPAVYFRLLLIGYFEGLDSERGIAWRASDSLALRDFLGLALHKAPPDHSTISRTRRLIDLETHEAVFVWVLEWLAQAKLLKGTTLGVDGTTLEANAALRSIVRHRRQLSGVPHPAREGVGDRDADAGRPRAPRSAAEEERVER